MSEEIVKKTWGHERILHNDSKYCMKELTILPGFRSSLHRHLQKEETFLVVAGIATIEFEFKIIKLVPGEHVTIPPETWHRFWTTSPRCIVVEASTMHWDQDVERKEKSYAVTPPGSCPACGNPGDERYHNPITGNCLGDRS